SHVTRRARCSVRRRTRACRSATGRSSSGRTAGVEVEWRHAAIDPRAWEPQISQILFVTLQRPTGGGRPPFGIERLHLSNLWSPKASEVGVTVSVPRRSSQQASELVDAHPSLEQG